jgi:tripartite-type tricarboxylate transporter receptor subunit TctC
MLFARRVGLEWTYVPSKGGAQTINDVLGGQVDLQFNSVFSTGGHVKAGKLRALGTSSEERLPDFPDVPAIAEIVPGFAAGGYQGIFAPAGTPTKIINKLSEEIVRILAMPDIKEKLVALGAEPVGSSPDEMSTFLREDEDRWAKLVKELNFNLDE